MSEELVADINELFAKLVLTVKDKHLRQLLAKLNKHLSDTSGGVIAYVNWNS